MNNPDHLTDIQSFINHSWSGGVVDGLLVSSNGDGTIALTSGEVAIRNANDNHATIYIIPVSAVSSFTLTDNATNYICADYNAGNPIIVSTTDYSTINQTTRIPISAVTRVGTKLTILNAQELVVSYAAKSNTKDFETAPFRKIRGGSILSSSGLSLRVSNGAIYFMSTRIAHPAFDTTIAGTANKNVFTYVYTGWNRITAQKTINNTQYDSSGTLTAMPNNSYRTDFVYIVSNNPSELVVLMGNTTYNKQADAINALPPTVLPPEIQGAGLLIGKVTVQKSATTLSVVIVSDISTSSSPTQIHNELSGLQGGTTGEYYHLTASQQSSISSGYNGTVSVRNGANTGAISLTFTNGILTSVV